MTNRCKQKSGTSGLKKANLALKGVGSASKRNIKSKDKPNKGFRKTKIVVKNILENPFAVELFYIEAECEAEIVLTLKSCFKGLKVPSCKPPWNEVQSLKKGEERRKYCEDYRRAFMEKMLSNTDSAKQYEIAKEAHSHLIFGYNAVMRALEKNDIAGILVKKDASPLSIIETFLPGCVNKSIPLVPLLGLDKILQSEDTLAVAHSVMVLGLKLSVREESCRFYPLYEKIIKTVESMQNAHHAFQLEHDSESANAYVNNEKENVPEDACSFESVPYNKENVWEVKQENNDSDNEGPVDVKLYHLKRTRKNERVFVPKTKEVMIEESDMIPVKDDGNESNFNWDFIPAKADSKGTNFLGDKQKPFLGAFKKKPDVFKPKPTPSTLDFQFSYFLDKEGDNVTKQNLKQPEAAKSTKRKIKETGNETKMKKKKKKYQVIEKSEIKDKILSKKDKKTSQPLVVYPHIPAKTKRIKNNPDRKGNKSKQ